MVQKIKSSDRGYADHGWLKSFHTFSFADYHNPEMMGFSDLRVINEDFVEQSKGFPTHPHRDMEIITIVLSGCIEHRDTLGNHAKILPGEVQVMSAGTGIRHSEFNPLADQELHLLQIWILPNQAGHTPRYDQKSFADELDKKNWVCVVSGDSRDQSLMIHQDAVIWKAKLHQGAVQERSLQVDRSYWVQVTKGQVEINGEQLVPGDALAVVKESELKMNPQSDCEFILFDLPS